MHSVRARFDNYSHWIAFIIIASFIAYFLTSMIRLANKEDERYNTAVLEGYQDQNMLVKDRRTQVLQNGGVDENGNVLSPDE